MKVKTDPRHQKRVEKMKKLYSYSFNQSALDPDIISIVEQLPVIDDHITTCAPEWPLDQINRIDLSVLRLSISELLAGDTPFKVVIDEAVEIAKEFGSENSAKFVNGVLGAVLVKLESN